MKKVLTLVVLMCILILCIAGCSGPVPSTAYSEHGADYKYSVGEEIKIFDNKSDQLLCTVTVTDAIVLKDEPFNLEEFYGYDDNDEPVYKEVQYEAVIQVNYTYKSIDSYKKIFTDNFSVTDVSGNSAELNPEVEYTTSDTNDNYFVVAVKEKGEFINVGFAFYTSQYDVANITTYYEDATSNNEFENSASDNAQENEKGDKNTTPTNDTETTVIVLILICAGQGILIFVLLILLIIFLCKKTDYQNKS